MASKQDIAKIMAILLAAYPRFSMTDQTVEIYYLLLKDIEPESLLVATKRCATTQEFFPTVYELRRAVADSILEAQGIPSAYQAWEEVRHFPTSGALKRIIQEQDPEKKLVWIIEEMPVFWSHPLVEQVARQMGWPAFPGENLSTDRAHFFRAYEYALDAALEDSVQLPEVRSYVQNLQTGPVNPVLEGIRKLSGEWSST